MVDQLNQEWQGRVLQASHGVHDPILQVGTAEAKQ